MLGKIEGRRRRGQRRMRWLDGITYSMDMIWVGSRSWWWTGMPGMLQSMGSQRVEHNEWLNWTDGIQGRASGMRPWGLEPTTQTAPEFTQSFSQFYFSLGVDIIFYYWRWAFSIWTGLHLRYPSLATPTKERFLLSSSIQFQERLWVAQESHPYSLDQPLLSRWRGSRVGSVWDLVFIPVAGEGCHDENPSRIPWGRIRIFTKAKENITWVKRDLKLLFLTVEGGKSWESMAKHSPRSKKVSNEHSLMFTISKLSAESHIYLTSSDSDYLRCHLPLFHLNCINCWDDIVNQKLSLAFEQPGHFWRWWAIQTASSDSCSFWNNSGIWFTIVLGSGFKLMDANSGYSLFSKKKICPNGRYRWDWLKGVLSEKLENDFWKAWLEKSRNR